MLESINIKTVASYDDTGIQINGLKKVNFIYGANGCGKTTISNFLHNGIDLKFGSCNAGWKNSLPLKTLVYNKQFRELNFGNGKINGVFTLGEATTEEIETIRLKTLELKEIKSIWVLKKETVEKQSVIKQNADDKFKEETWLKIYKKHESIFKEAFVGFLTKEGFKNKLLHEFNANISPLQTFLDLKEKAKTIFGEVPVNITPIGLITFDRILEIENDPIWHKIIVGKADVDIAKLIQKLNINDWVNQGRNYLQEDLTCPFCQQATITEDFKKQLGDYFDETYLSDLNSIKTLKDEYNLLIDNLINELNSIESNQKIFAKSKLENDKFSSYLKTLISQTTTNKEFLNNKAKEPSRTFELISLKEQLDLIINLVNDANKAISKHNDIVTNFNSEKTNLTKAVWRYVVNEYKTDIDLFIKSADGIQKYIDKLKIEVEEKRVEHKTLNEEIKRLSKTVTSIQPTIDEINTTLKSLWIS